MIVSEHNFTLLSGRLAPQQCKAGRKQQGTPGNSTQPEYERMRVNIYTVQQHINNLTNHIFNIDETNAANMLTDCLEFDGHDDHEWRTVSSQSQ